MWKFWSNTFYLLHIQYHTTYRFIINSFFVSLFSWHWSWSNVSVSTIILVYYVLVYSHLYIFYYTIRNIQRKLWIYNYTYIRILLACVEQTADQQMEKTNQRERREMYLHFFWLSRNTNNWCSIIFAHYWIRMCPLYAEMDFIYFLSEEAWNCMWS